MTAMNQMTLPGIEPVHAAAVAGSSNVAELAWANETLYIKFHKSGWYAYAGATLADYTALRDAESVGGHFHSHIKKSFDARHMGVADLALSS